MLSTIEAWELEPKFGDLAELAHNLLSLFSWDGSLPMQIVDFECLFRGSNTDQGYINGLLFFWGMLPLVWTLSVFLLFLFIFEVRGFMSVVVANQDQSTESKASPPHSPGLPPGQLALQNGPASGAPLSAIVPVQQPSSPV